jgi:hypothetical protein
MPADTTIELWDGTELRRNARFTFTGEEAAIIHHALRTVMHDRIRHPYTDRKVQRTELYELARLLTKIDGRLRPMPD